MLERRPLWDQRSRHLDLSSWARVAWKNPLAAARTSSRSAPPSTPTNHRSSRSSRWRATRNSRPDPAVVTATAIADVTTTADVIVTTVGVTAITAVVTPRGEATPMTARSGRRAKRTVEPASNWLRLLERALVNHGHVRVARCGFEPLTGVKD